MNVKSALKAFAGRDGERAVSPVIGVILMVAITVILAAVIGTFVLGLGDRVSQASPNAQWNFEYSGSAGNAEAIKIVHDGGDGIESSQLTVTVNGNDAWDSSGFYGDGASPDNNFDGNEWTGKLTAGSSLKITEETNDAIKDGHSVKIIWSASGSDKTAVIGQSEVSV